MVVDIMVWSYAALLGAINGSFLNVCIARWPEGESVVRPRSRCPGCGTQIAWYDNVPVLSYVALGARCRSCSAPISVQYPLVELATALLWLAAAVRFGPSVEGLRTAVFLTILLAIALIDARHMIILDQFSLGGMVLGLLFAAVPGGIGFWEAVLGAGVGYAGLWAVAIAGEKVFRKPALGVGDIHMMAMVGAFLGLPGVLLTLLLGSLLGLLIGVPVSYFRGQLKVLGTYLPLGTFLALGAAIAHGWGDVIIRWYLSFLPA